MRVWLLAMRSPLLLVCLLAGLAVFVNAGCVNFDGCNVVPGGEPIGAPCVSAEDCRSLVCLPLLNVCSQSCAGGASCPAGTYCQDAEAYGRWCLPGDGPADGPCVPRCDGRTCGFDGCGGICSCRGGALAGERAPVDTPCQPHATRRCLGNDVWWFDGCWRPEEVIAVCPAHCDRGECVDCVPDCAGKACGSDPACGASCGSCAAGSLCLDGQCVADPCAGRACGPGEDGRPCGACAERGRYCDVASGQCVPGCDSDVDCGYGGRCQFDTHVCDCPDGVTSCGGVCAETGSDPAHCGDCDVACGDDEGCRSGGCVGGCLVPGAGCPPNELCNESTETCDCRVGYHRCDGTCRADDDPEHCGADCQRCPPTPNADPACRQGRCTFWCHVGYRFCQTRCAPCPQAGAVRWRCDGTECVASACTTGYKLCGDICAPCPAVAPGTRTWCDGTDCVPCLRPGRVCGQTCVSCPTAGVVSTTCVDGACVAAQCTSGYRVCDGRCAPCPSDGVATVGCVAGACVAATCEPGYRMCDGACAPCPGDGVAMTACVAGACQPGYQMCDGRCAPCPTDGVARVECAADACVATRCQWGYRLCDGACALCPEGASAHACDGGNCVAISCTPPARGCGGDCVSCPTYGVAATECRADTCVATSCEATFRLCDGRCAPCATDGVAATVCEGAACVVTGCAPDHRRCDGRCLPCPTAGVAATACSPAECVVAECLADHRLCDGACAPCPTTGVETTTCAGAACVAVTCADDYRLCDGACVPCPTTGVETTRCAGDSCAIDTCRAGFRLCDEHCLACPVAGVEETACAETGCVATTCRSDGGYRLCEGLCAPCPEGVAENTACAGTDCVPGCAAGEQWCRGQCPRCEVGEATTTGCGGGDGTDCVALACVAGHLLCDDTCAPCPDGALEPYCSLRTCATQSCAVGFERCADGESCCPPCPPGEHRCDDICCPWELSAADGRDATAGDMASVAVDPDGRAVLLVDGPSGARLLREGPAGATWTPDDAIPTGSRGGDIVVSGGVAWYGLDTPDGVVVRWSGADGGGEQWLTGPRAPEALAAVGLVVADGDAVVVWEEPDAAGGARLVVRDFTNGVWYPARETDLATGERGFGRKRLVAGPEGTRVLYLVTTLPGEPARHFTRRGGLYGGWTERDDLPALGGADVAFDPSGLEPHLCGETPDGLVYAWHDGADWQSETLVPGLSGVECALGGTIGPYVAFTADGGLVGVVERHSDPTEQPSLSLVADGPDEVHAPALTTASERRPVIVWRNATSGRFELARAAVPLGY